MELGEGFRAVAALEQERLTVRGPRERGLQATHLARKDEWRTSSKLGLCRGECGRIGIIGDLMDRLRPPALGRPVR